MENIGEKIYNLRKEKGVSQEELAYNLDVARQTVSKWERDVATPTTENITSLCEFFDVKTTYFFDEIAETAVAECVSEKRCSVQKTVKNGSVKIAFTVLGMILLSLFVIASAIGLYVVLMPEMGGAWSSTTHTVSYNKIIFLVIFVIVTAIFITLSILLILNCIKKRKKKKNKRISVN